MIKFLKQLVSFLSPYSMASIDPLVAYTMVEEGTALLVDSRELEELRDGMIEGALWIPLSTENLLQKIEKVADRKTNIFIYGNYEQSADKLSHILQAMNYDASVIGTFESLEERLPVRVFKESSEIEHPTFY